MKMKQLPFEEDIAGLLRTAIRGGQRKSEVPGRLATALGVDPKNVRNWIKGGQWRWPAAALPTVCATLGDFKVLDFIEEKVGRVAFPVAVQTESAVPGIIELHEFVREVGEALERLSDTLKDGRVVDEELAPTFKEIDDVIRQCVRLKHMLRVLNAREHRLQTG